MFSFRLAADAQIEYDQTMPLRGNALDVAVVEAHGSIVVSVDNLHTSGSKGRRGESKDEKVETLLQMFTLSADSNDASWKESTGNMSKVEKMCNEGSHEAAESDIGALKDLLYHTENLRKRGTDE